MLQRSFDRWKWLKEEKHFHINVLGVTGIKFCNLTFTKNFSHLTIHVQVNNKVVLAYLLKMGVTHSFQRSASQFRVICYIIR